MKIEEMKNKETVGKLARLILNCSAESGCFVGFDGYVDELYEVVRERHSACDYVKCDTIAEFGSRIMNASGKSADIEIIPCKVKLGGNAPILANALTELGFHTVCVGQMDVDNDVNPFSEMSPSCQKISTGPASRTIALEFSDGKIMLGALHGNNITWEQLKRRAGTEALYQKMKASRLLCFVNWGGFYHMNEILLGVFQEILLPIRQETNLIQDIFIDLSDPSSKEEAEMNRLFDIIREISAHCRVTVGMNENEAEKIGRKICTYTCVEEMGEQVRRELGLFQLVIHLNHRAYGFREGIQEEFCGMHVERPVQLTGAGDHFNAGFCMGVLEDLDMRECLILGQAMASCYVETGVTANRKMLSQYMENYCACV